MIKILIADDSMLMRLMIKNILSQDASLEVVGTASDGQEAYQQTLQLRPDVVLMDMTMGDYDGLYAIRQIMAHCPTPILILSAMGNRDMDVILEGMHLGAVDYLNKPAKHQADLHAVEPELLEKIKSVAQARPVHWAQPNAITNTHAHSFFEELNFEIVVIGASTGGPSALEQIVTQLPANLPIPVVLIQHIPQHFVQPFAERLNRLTPMTITVAQQQMPLEKGRIYLVPSEQNTLLRRNEDQVVFDFTQQKYPSYNFPSVDSVLLSAADVYGKKAIGVVLTGMGRDGALGIKAIREAGGLTIAQNQASCAVYGMPRAAVEEGGAEKVVPLKEIAFFLVNCLS